MAETCVTIDLATLTDDPHGLQVEFDGEASGETYRFAVRYDALEALCGRYPNGEAVAVAGLHADAIATAAAHALARGYDLELVIVSENDLV